MNIFPQTNQHQTVVHRFAQVSFPMPPSIFDSRIATRCVCTGIPIDATTANRIPKFALVVFGLLMVCSTLRASAQGAVQRAAIVPARKLTLGLATPATASSTGTATTAAAQTPAPATTSTSTPPETAPTEANEEPDAETKLILDTLKTLPEDERQAMVAYYKDLGIDLATWLQPKPTETSTGGARRQLVRLMRTVNFVRRPEAVLDARGRIGLESETLPPTNASDQEIVQWFHRHAMAAEWDAVKALLVMRAGTEAEGMYAALIQGTNHAESELIPEDVLGLSEAAPAELTDWQVDALAGLLRAAARKTSTRPLIERFRQGTTWFGSKDDAQRDRTVRLLLAADLPIEAYEFMPSLDEARAEKNAPVLKGHAEYHLARAAETNGTESDRMVETAWSIFGEVALLSEADTAIRSESLGRAVDLLPRVPPGPGLKWLRDLFQHPSLAPAGLQAVALKALKLEDEKLPEAVRAQAILTMKEAVDTLLAQQNLQFDQLKIPLRMLTIGLLARAENAIKEQGNKNGVSEVAALLLRSMPDDAWRAQIEPSLVGRAYNAFIGIALIADETDLAIELLSQGIERQPSMSVELATQFLDLWVLRMRARMAQPTTSSSAWLYSYSRAQRPSAPVTRGWQNRNLDRLAELLGVLDNIGIDGRQLPGVVTALKSCYGPTQAYERDSIERILGPVNKIKAPVAAALASTMRQGLSGDWRSREAQKDAGFERSESEVRKIVEQGYDLATALAEAAVTNSESEQDAWQHATLKAAITFDRMQFRGEREQDAVAYYAARNMVFKAFQDAALLYRRALAEGRVRASMQIYDVWFSLALGASDLGALTLEDLMTEGLENADQIDRIRADIEKMSPEQASYHLGEFARGVMANLPQSKPEVKPRLLQSAARVVGDHPAGAPIQRTLALYDELVQDEIHLHLAIDGSDRVGTEPFGAILTLQHTASIDRSSGGFARYLMDSYTEFNAGQWTTINYQERFRKSIETSFNGKVELLGIGFFQPMNPAVPIRMEGQAGWQEKPMAYLVLQAVDPSVDRLPAVQMDMHFNDASGPIVLPIVSNTVLVDAASPPRPRPVADLVIEQTLDARPMLDQKKDKTVKLEIVARCTGVLPEVDRLLSSLESALPGYQLDQAQLVSDPFDVSQTHRAQPEEDDSNQPANPYAYAPERLPNLDPDPDGMFRLGTMRKWIVNYVPEATSVLSAPDQFIFPEVDESKLQSLVSNTDSSAELSSPLRSIERYTYEDYDLVPVEGHVLTFDEQKIPLFAKVLAGLAILLVVGGIWLLIRGRRGAVASEDASVMAIPSSLSPTGAALLLSRIEQGQAAEWSADEKAQLRAEIEAIQHQHFASANGSNGETNHPNDAYAELVPTVQRWAQKARIH